MKCERIREIQETSKSGKRDEVSIKRFFSLSSLSHKMSEFIYKHTRDKIDKWWLFYLMSVTVDQRNLVQTSVTKVSDSMQNDRVGNFPW